MTQEELRTKLESYDTNEATLNQLIADRDFARDMYLSCTRKYSAVYDAVRNTTCECYKEIPTRELDDATTELLRAIRLEGEIYHHHAETLGCEINERLSKIDNN